MNRAQKAAEDHFTISTQQKQQNNPEPLNQAVKTNHSATIQSMGSTSIQGGVLSTLEIRRLYKLHQKILQPTSISQNMRARLRSFLMIQSSKQFILRETCTLACTYIDLYFLNEGLIEVTQFQTLAIGCLILATKFIEGKFPTISFNIFSLEELLAYEKRIMKRLDYNVCPPTYHTFAERIIYAWDEFVQEQKIYNLKFTELQAGVNLKIRTFYEQLDVVYMVVKSLDYDVETLVVILFYLNARMLNIIHIPDAYKLSDDEFTKLFFPSKDNFLGFFQKFLPSYSNNKITMKIEIAKYLKHFLVVVPKRREWLIKSTKQNQQIVEMMRQWDRIQTSPRDDYVIAKSIMEKVNSPPNPLLPRLCTQPPKKK